MQIIQDIPGYADFVTVVPITKGWSGDSKYYIETKDDAQYLLRVGDISQYKRFQHAYAMMQKVAALGVPMQQPVGFGVCNGGESVFQLLTWLAGADAAAELPQLPIAEQYALGMRAGQILQQIHSIAAPAGIEDWATRYGRKTDWRIAAFHRHQDVALPLGAENSFLQFVTENRHLIANRPQVYQHGDYHPSNMIIGADGSLAIIDWNRDDYGDPWEEFVRIPFTVRDSPQFANGMLHGYFAGDPPLEFFRLLALYLASNALGAYHYAVQFGADEIEFTRAQNAMVLRWYDNMRTVVPTWYRPAAGATSKAEI